MPGWRTLGLSWIVVLALLGAGGTWLNHLGPPEPAAADVPAAPRSDEDVARPPAPETPPAPAPAATAAVRPGGETPADPAQLSSPSAAPSQPTVPGTGAAPDAAPRPLPVAPEPPPLPAGPAGGPAGAAPAVQAPIPPPDPALLEPGRHGPVPRTAADGRTALRTYARAWNRQDARPRVALAIGGIGLHGALSEEAIRRLPPEVGLVFSPYAARPDALAARARERGMEMLLALPLEPAGYPQNDPGPQALLTGSPRPEIEDRLSWTLSRLQGYVGVVGALGPMRGDRFAAVPALMNGLQDQVRERGLFYLDPRPTPPARAWGRGADVVVDEPATRSEIARRLAELEEIAHRRGSALGYAGDASPVLVERVAGWAAGLDARGLVLVPVTATARRPDQIPR